MVKPVGGTWSAPRTLSGDGASDPKVTLDPTGNAVAAWSRYIGGGAIAEASIRPQGGDWTPAHQLNLSPSGGSATGQVAFTPSGDALVVWVRDDGANRSVAYTANDVTPPTPGAVTVPGAAVAKRAVAMSMTAPSIAGRRSGPSPGTSGTGAPAAAWPSPTPTARRAPTP